MGRQAEWVDVRPEIYDIFLFKIVIFTDFFNVTSVKYRFCIHLCVLLFLPFLTSLFFRTVRFVCARAAGPSGYRLFFCFKKNAKCIRTAVTGYGAACLGNMNLVKMHGFFYGLFYETDIFLRNPGVGYKEKLRADV